MTLDEFSELIMKPTLISAIKEGKVDNALADPDCLEIILNDKDLFEAYKFRIENRK